MFLDELENLMEVAYSNKSTIREQVAKMVSTYHPEGKHPSEEKGEAYEKLLKTIRA